MFRIISTHYQVGVHKTIFYLKIEITSRHEFLKYSINKRQNILNTTILRPKHYLTSIAKHDSINIPLIVNILRMYTDILYNIY